jgi:hypothetical protein
MTTIVVLKCSSRDPTLACLKRHEAQERGAFWPSPAGWLWSGSMDVLKKWEVCPWCGSPIPELTPVILRAMDDPGDVDDEC